MIRVDAYDRTAVLPSRSFFLRTRHRLPRDGARIHRGDIEEDRVAKMHTGQMKSARLLASDRDEGIDARCLPRGQRGGCGRHCEQDQYRRCENRGAERRQAKQLCG